MSFNNNNNIMKELHEAVVTENLEKVKILLSAGDNVNRILNWKCDKPTLLHCARSVEMTKMLLLYGAEIYRTNSYGETPLCSAVTEGKKIELVTELLKHGAYVNATDRKWNTPLNHAVKSGKMDVVEELLKHGADINLKDREFCSFEDGASSLDNAIDDLECCKLLIKFTLIKNFDKDYKKAIDLNHYIKCENYSKLVSYLDDCVCEVLQMKTDDHPLYELVTNASNIRHVLCNNHLCIKLAKTDFSKHYPIYNDIILDMIKPFLKREDLLNELSQLQIYTGLNTLNCAVKGEKVILNFYSTCHVAEYLSNDDLLNFIKAFNNPENNAAYSSSIDDEPSTSNCAKRVKLE